MHVGIEAFAAPGHVGVAELARPAEEASLGSLFQVQYTHLTVGRCDLLEKPGEEDILTPAERAGIPDPFVALGAAVAVTQRLNLGTGACTRPSTIRSCSRNRPPRSTRSPGAGSFSASPRAGMTCCSAITASTLSCAGRSCARRCSR